MMNELAWYVSADDECSWIIFAESEQAAKDAAASEFGCDAEDAIATWKSEYDCFASRGYVPPKVLIDDGWWFECWECQRRVDEENEQEAPEDSEEDYYYPEPVFEGKVVFCSQNCCDAWHCENESAMLWQVEAKKLLLERYPNAVELTVNGGNTGYQVYASFKFGGIGRAEWNSDQPDTVSIRQDDKEAFEQWRAKEPIAPTSESPLESR